MLNFYEFYMLMEQQQTYLFQAGHRELYHGSNSGPNDSIAKSFISKGAQSGTGADRGGGGGRLYQDHRSGAKFRA